MYDADCFMWSSDILGSHSLGARCTHVLPSGPYQSLQYALDGTWHTSNEIIANQDKSPDSLNLHEFYSFASLRCGHRLQWRNIARELVSRILNFSHNETYFLVVQAAWEAGPPAQDIFRGAHLDLAEEEFGLSLLAALDDAFSTVENNWQGAPAVRTFTALSARLLSLSPHAKVHTICLQFLHRVRTVALQWTREVVHLIHDTEGDAELNSLTDRALDLALTCHGTFDVDLVHLHTVLSSAENVASLIECAVTIHDRSPSSPGEMGAVSYLLNRSFYLSHIIEKTLRDIIVSNQDGMNMAVGRLWAGYKPGTSWVSVEAPNDSWVRSETLINPGKPLIIVHFNVLTGSLLVNGSPLSRLPKDYESHTTYQRLFGKKVLDVVPSSMSNMIFQTRREFHGQQIHFRLHEGELIIRTSLSGRTHELIPISVLKNDFPRAFVNKYVHWIDLEYGVMEWRPLENIWKSSPQNWQTWSHGNSNFSLGRAPLKLVDIRSPIAKAISRVLSPLEHATHIHVFFNFDKNMLEVHLPRLNLDFFMRGSCNLLECKQFRGMAVDSNQGIGSLSGLVNKLVLREVFGQSRLIIVPDGKVSYKQADDHVCVSVDTSSVKIVSYHHFQVDSQLGRLVDNGSLRSRLYRAYLHALTSACLPDELTGRTGTEEALHTLAQASTQSFFTLEGSEVNLLKDISRLSPGRIYYPKHL